MENKGPTIDPQLLSRIAAACRDCEGLRFGYRSQDGVSTRRHVEPHRLVHTGRRWYLAAWDRDREDWRTFRLDRIDPQTPRPALRFTPREPPEGDFAAYVARSITYTPWPYQARVILHTSVEAAAERLPPGAGTLEGLEGGTCMLHTGAYSLDRLCVWLALIGFDFEVREPAELVERVRGLAERFGRAVNTGGCG
jgi:predicted DNA-binding transcriptional regulator YafY